MNKGSQLIAEERQRQIEVEGFAPDHDREMTEFQLAKAAACYVISYFHYQTGSILYAEFIRYVWPFDWKWWKPKTPYKDPIRDLVRAGALIAAEIDRLKEEGK